MKNTLKKSGIKDAVETIEEVVFIPANAADIKRTFKNIHKHSVASEKTEAADVKAFALVALPVLEEMAVNGMPIMLDSVRATMFTAAGYVKPDAKAVGYRTLMNRTKLGIQAALLSYHSDKYRLADDGQLEAHNNALNSTFVYRDEDGGVIDPKADNTPEKNPKALDFEPVRQGQFQNQMVKAGLATVKGPDNRQSGDATAAQNPDNFSGIMSLRDLITGRSTGKVADLKTLTKPELEAVLAAIEIANVAHTQGLANNHEKSPAMSYVKALLSTIKAAALDAVA